MASRVDDRDCEVCDECGVEPNHQGGCICADDGRGHLYPIDGHEGVASRGAVRRQPRRVPAANRV